jgi:hypothetical protein
MSYTSKHSASDEPTPAFLASCIGWVLQLEYTKVTVGWTDGPSSVSSAPDDPTPRPAVHPTPSFKLDRDAPRISLRHRMNRRFMETSVVHPTPVFKPYSTAPSGCYSAPDRPTVRGYIASVHWLGHLVQRLFQRLWVTDWSDACARGTIGSSRYYFSGKLFQRLATLARPIIWPPALLSYLCHWRSTAAKERKRLCYCSFSSSCLRSSQLVIMGFKVNIMS